MIVDILMEVMFKQMTGNSNITCEYVQHIHAYRTEPSDLSTPPLKFNLANEIIGILMETDKEKFEHKK